MTYDMPNFIKSKYFSITSEGWKLKENAPDSITTEFEQYIKVQKQWESEFTTRPRR